MSKRLLSIMSDVLKKPNMYLGETSVSRLSCYILGYNTACVETIDDHNLFAKSGRFSNWITKKYRMFNWVTLAWAGILLKICDNDEEKAFELLIKEWDEFCNLPEERATDLDDEITRPRGTQMDDGLARIQMLEEFRREDGNE